jgi:2-keto-4-pentenoate hydratase/2-oxohepta-3-ene-1,7-dioic acid hydratase in catechol pathway
MKLVRYGLPGAEKPGMIDRQGTLRELSGEISDIDGLALQPAALAHLSSLDPARLPKAQERPRFGPPVGRIGKVVAIGLNYADHAKAAGLALPKEPIVFLKANGSIMGPDDAVIIPPGSQKSDWEVELAVAIGRPASYVAEADALKHVAGYLICNDISEREYQTERCGQWDKGKGFDTFCPLGPWLVTPDEISDPQALDLWLDLNGKRMQTGNTRTMAFKVAHLVHYVSQFMSLQPGDIITTGTPAGVGGDMKPPRYLKPGDKMRLGIAGVGEQTQTAVAWSPPAG